MIVTSDVEEGQGALLMDHVRIVTPGEIFVRPVFLKSGFANVPDPETLTHNPVPAVGALPAKKVEAVPVVAQSVWFGPAFEMLGVLVPTILITSVVATQGAFEIVQRKSLLPTLKPVTPEVGLVGVVTVAVPVTTVQSPVPAVGVFAAKVAPELIQTV